MIWTWRTVHERIVERLTSHRRIKGVKLRPRKLGIKDATNSAPGAALFTHPPSRDTHSVASSPALVSSPASRPATASPGRRPCAPGAQLTNHPWRGLEPSRKPPSPKLRCSLTCVSPLSELNCTHWSTNRICAAPHHTKQNQAKKGGVRVR